jgi:hypothetical protein
MHYRPEHAVLVGLFTPHRILEEEIGNNRFTLSRPLSESPEPNGITGVFAISNLDDGQRTRVSMFGKRLTFEQQEIALAMFRSIEF